MNNILENEQICDLQYEGLVCLQKKNGYGFTCDAVLLANFVKCSGAKKVVEFCSGSGVISILVNAKNKVKEIDAIEIQEELAAMCNRTLEINNIKNIKVINTSFQNYTLQTKPSSVDVVMANPPYFKAGSGKLPSSEEVKTAKFETECTLNELIMCASKLLKDGGKFYMVHITSRKAEILKLLTLNNLNLSKICMIQAKENSKPHIFLIEAVKNKAANLINLPNSILT